MSETLRTALERAIDAMEVLRVGLALRAPDAIAISHEGVLRHAIREARSALATPTVPAGDELGKVAQHVLDTFRAFPSSLASVHVGALDRLERALTETPDETVRVAPVPAGDERPAEGRVRCAFGHWAWPGRCQHGHVLPVPAGPVLANSSSTDQPVPAGDERGRLSGRSATTGPRTSTPTSRTPSSLPVSASPKEGTSDSFR